MEGTVQVTQSRISTCDNYKVQVADPAKTARLQKEHQLRKVMQVNLTTLLRLQSLVSFYSHNHVHNSTDEFQRKCLCFFSSGKQGSWSESDVRSDKMDLETL